MEHNVGIMPKIIGINFVLQLLGGNLSSFSNHQSVIFFKGKLRARAIKLMFYESHEKL
jgi:hypothetical protein